MELNDQSKGKTPGGTRAKAARLDAEAAAEAHVEEEIEKDVAEYKDELVTKEETDELEVEKEAVAEDGIEAAAEKPEADKGAVAAAEAAADEPEAERRRRPLSIPAPTRRRCTPSHNGSP